MMRSSAGKTTTTQLSFSSYYHASQVDVKMPCKKINYKYTILHDGFHGFHGFYYGWIAEFNLMTASVLFSLVARLGTRHKIDDLTIIHSIGIHYPTRRIHSPNYPQKNNYRGINYPGILIGVFQQLLDSQGRFRTSNAKVGP
jgi:hypothetical protein